VDPGTLYFGLAVVGAGSIWLGRKLLGQREKDYRKWAAVNDYRYHETAPSVLPEPYHKRLGIFRRGARPRYSHVLSRRGHGREEYWFDFSYVVSSGKNATTVWHTVAAFRIADWGLPAFELKPENVFHKIGSRFGYQDIDFSESPKFSSNYLLRGEDEAAVRETFGIAILDFLGANKGWYMDAWGDWLFVYRIPWWNVRRLPVRRFDSYRKEIERLVDFFLEGRPAPESADGD
jgi:hypothetical protein